jgi:hypothetical protein
MTARPIAAGMGDERTWTRAHRRALDAIEADPDTIDVAIELEIERLARIPTDDPAECWRALTEYEIDIDGVRVRVHGESMEYGRAQLEIAAMIRRGDDADAIRCVESDIRRELVGAFERSSVLREKARENVEREWGLL